MFQLFLWVHHDLYTCCSKWWWALKGAPSVAMTIFKTQSRLLENEVFFFSLIIQLPLKKNSVTNQSHESQGQIFFFIYLCFLPTVEKKKQCVCSLNNKLLVKLESTVSDCRYRICGPHALWGFRWRTRPALVWFPPSFHLINYDLVCHTAEMRKETNNHSINLFKHS